jgi:hypothetical protein
VECLADGPRGVHGQSVWAGFLTDGPRCLHRRSEFWGCSTGGSRVIFGQSALCLRTVRLGLADGPPGARGPSAWCLVELLSPFLLELRFLAALSWGLFLRLVGLLWETRVGTIGCEFVT